MHAFRICKAAYARRAFDGEGARNHPGRWNFEGVPMVYVAGSLALACLELFVHLDPEDMPDDLVSVRIEIPGDVEIEDVDRKKLPRGWRRVPAPRALQALGSDWAMSRRTVALRVPSAIIPEEHNVLLNPLHEDMAKIVRGVAQKFVFDPRMRR